MSCVPQLSMAPSVLCCFIDLLKGACSVMPGLAGSFE